MSDFELPAEWRQILDTECDQDYYRELISFLQRAYAEKEIYPPSNLVFNALMNCSFSDLKVVVLGQDPYHQAGQAHGLAFSVPTGMRVPPSLANIYKELATDLPGFEVPKHGNLIKWTNQGVLLLNSVLTVEANLPGSHKNMGWQKFTDAIITQISARKSNLVFLLWGAYAIKKTSLIDQSKHLVLQAAHPSPLARGAFFGNKHFSKANKYLIQNELKPINWQLT